MAKKTPPKQFGEWDMLTNPEALASVQQMPDERNKLLEAYQNLPSPVKRRVRALKKLQLDILKVEADFFREMNELEREFECKYQPLFEKRRNILTGDSEPNDDECDWKDEADEDADVNELGNDIKQKVCLEDGDKQENVHGIPDFWLTIFRNVPILCESKEDYDDAILSHLRDIQCRVNPADSRPGFTLDFHFSPNEYFTDSVLKKEYFVRFDPSTNDPLGFEGPEIIESKGCTIHWKPSKNVTIRIVKKTLKHKNRGEKKTISKTVKTKSFFNFFDPPKGCLDNMEEEDEEDEDKETEMQEDFELGQFIREQVISRAVLLYTGEGIEDEEDFDLDVCESEDEVDDEDD